MEPAPRSLAIAVDLAGTVNDVPVRGAGVARLALPGRCRIELTVESVPLSWDPLLAVLALLDAAIVAALLPHEEGEEPEDAFLYRLATLRDEQSREAGFERCTGHLSWHDGEVACQIEPVHAAHFVPVERVVGAVEGMAMVAPLGGHLPTLASSYALETSWGNGYRLAATTTAESHGELEGVQPALVRVRLAAPQRELLGLLGERTVVEAGIGVRELRQGLRAR